MTAVTGTAGWSIASRHAAHFPSEGSALQRYAARFTGVEINSSFYRPHRPETWRRWAGSVPESFRFAVKLPRTITHERRLADCGALAASFLEEVQGLGGKLAVILVQFPPKFAFDAGLAEAFLASLAQAAPARIACEPRHPSWFGPDADRLLDSLGVARVAADPAVVPAAALPGGWRGLAYWRLHGSPITYRSSYDEARLDSYAALVRGELEAGREAWCMFDNTLSAFATVNALALMERL
jgi:uncharacterized protein YecE (DUF72 family)